MRRRTVIMVAIVMGALLVPAPAGAVVDEMVGEWCNPNGGHLSPPGISDPTKGNFAKPLFANGMISFTDPDFMGSGKPLLSFDFDHPASKIVPNGDPVDIGPFWITPFTTDDNFAAFAHCNGYTGGSGP